MTFSGLDCETKYDVIARALFLNDTQEGPGFQAGDITTNDCPCKHYLVDT